MATHLVNRHFRLSPNSQVGGHDAYERVINSEFNN